MKSLFPTFFYRIACRPEKMRLMLFVLFLNGLYWGCSSGSEQGPAGQEVREFTLESALNSGREDKKEIGEHGQNKAIGGRQLVENFRFREGSSDYNVCSYDHLSISCIITFLQTRCPGILH